MVHLTPQPGLPFSGVFIGGFGQSDAATHDSPQDGPLTVSRAVCRMGQLTRCIGSTGSDMASDGASGMRLGCV